MYADDTLIVMKVDTSQLMRLKDLLQKFAKSTSLKINYRKYNLIPINVSFGRTYNS